VNGSKLICYHSTVKKFITSNLGLKYSRNWYKYQLW